MLLAVALQGGVGGLSGESAPLAARAEDRTAAVLSHVEVVTGGASADEALPLVIVLHGRGGSPERFVERFDRWPGRARVVVIGGPLRAGRGRAWFSRPIRTMEDAELDEELGDRVAAVARTIAEIRATRPTAGPTVLAGYSQGATVALALALRHPELSDEVVVASSWLPLRWIPERGTSSPSIQMTHGAMDRRLPVRDADHVHERLAARGYEVRMRRLAAGEHRLRGRAHGVFLGHLRSAVERTRAT